MAELKIEFGAEVLKQLGNAIKFALSRYDQTSVNKRGESAPELLRLIATAAGQEEALAKLLERYVLNPEMARYRGDEKLSGEETARLNDLVGKIETTFLSIKNNMRILDPTWLAHNHGIISVIGTFAFDGVLSYFTKDGRKAVLIDRSQSENVVSEIRGEASRLRDIADDIAKSLT